MPVSTAEPAAVQPHGEPRSKRCRLCEESSHHQHSRSGQQQAQPQPQAPVWQLQLDRDLVDTISAIYPEWFRGVGATQTMDGAESTAGGAGPPPLAQLRNSNAQQQHDPSPPKAVVDSSPIRIDQNKESLKVKLLLRRPFDQLVAQGIMPPQKAPAAFHGQRRQLERAKTGDVLKAKIQQRPPRQELERRHILEVDGGHADPSLAERRRMLKKARLADQLNDQLSHRPGPLELIQKNILHTEEPIEQAVKTGRIPYRATSEGQLNRPLPPHNYVNPEEDSQSSEGGGSPPPAGVQVGIPVVASPAPSSLASTLSPPSTSVSPAPQPVVQVVTPLQQQQQQQTPQQPQQPPQLQIQQQQPQLVLAPRATAVVSVPTAAALRTDAPGKADKNRKKSKSKTTPKARTIKFHEYKGPTTSHKGSSSSNSTGTSLGTIPGGTSPSESSYDLLLQQQTLLLQFQLQLQHKYPQIILPAASKQQTNNSQQEISREGPPPPPPPLPVNGLITPKEEAAVASTAAAASKVSARLEDMKVSDLKAELKRRSLPVSGSKPQLIERLKEYSERSSAASPPRSAASQSVGSPEADEKMEVEEPTTPIVLSVPSPASSVDSFERSKEDIVREQQRKIEQLQRELALSQMRLQAAARQEPPKAQMIALQKHLQARQQAQQQQQEQQQNVTLQMLQLQEFTRQQQQQEDEEQQQRRIQQQQIQQKQSDAAAVKRVLDTLMFNGRSKISPQTHLIATPQQARLLFANISHMNGINTINNNVERTSSGENNNNEQQQKKSHIKSEVVDDVLDILIRNGELPPSAANDPLTPVTPVSAGNSNKPPEPPVFPTPEEDVLGLELLEGLDGLDGVDFSQLAMELNEDAPPSHRQQSESQPVPMDTDDWLDSLIGAGGNGGTSTSGNYDPLLAVVHENDPFDPFGLEDLRSPGDLTAALTWDKVDFAAPSS